MDCSERTLLVTTGGDGATILARMGATIREQRSALGLSQRELSVRTGVDRAFLNGIENGKRNPTLVMLAKLAAGLNTTVGALASRL
jgi:transcriptional regulator with XRE-family HTH domain